MADCFEQAGVKDVREHMHHQHARLVVRQRAAAGALYEAGRVFYIDIDQAVDHLFVAVLVGAARQLLIDAYIQPWYNLYIQ